MIGWRTILVCLGLGSLLGIGVLAYLGHREQAAYDRGVQAGIDATTKRWNQEKLEVLQKTVELTKIKDATIKELQERLGRTQDEQAKRDATQRANLAAARTERDRLRDDLSQLTVDQARGHAECANDPALVFQRAATAEVGRLLDHCAGEYLRVSEAAEGAYSAGLSCQQSYDAVREAINGTPVE